jgi:polyphenol oxidase
VARIQKTFTNLALSIFAQCWPQANVTKVQALKSHLLRSTHGFFNREGGFSSGAFDGLNTSFAVGDDPAVVGRNLSLVCETLQLSPRVVFTALQVHGDHVIEAPFEGELRADALWTLRPKTAIGVRTADCVPVLIEDVRTQRVAAVHAGWRGVAASIATKVVRLFIEQGSKAPDLRVALGPCIAACCFEVSLELAQSFELQFGTSAVSGGAARIDLRRCIQLDLMRDGLAADQIDVLKACTACDQQFYSHRRDRGVTGRQLSVICCG